MFLIVLVICWSVFLFEGCFLFFDWWLILLMMIVLVWLLGFFVLCCWLGVWICGDF